MLLIPHCSSEPSTSSLSDEPLNTLLALKGVGKNFADIQALSNINLTVSRGEIYGLLGPNGAGKSTTINIICGLIRPSEGTVSVAGFDIEKNAVDAKRALGVVPQELALYTELNARQNLSFFGRLYGLNGTALKTRVDELLRLVRLDDRDKAPVGAFSGGMQRRLNIAAALLHKPSILLMDEPTVGLDPQNRENILAIVQKIAADGAAVLYSTHYMDEVERICDRIGIIDHGRLLTEGSLAELRLRSGGKQILTLRGRFDVSQAEATFDFQQAEVLLKFTEDEIVLNLAGAEGRLTSILNAAAKAGEVREVSMNRQSLESLFIQLTGHELRE
jgi:ABC-2 type transport system ATP-binding protein